MHVHPGIVAVTLEEVMGIYVNGTSFYRQGVSPCRTPMDLIAFLLMVLDIKSIGGNKPDIHIALQGQQGRSSSLVTGDPPLVRFKIRNDFSLPHPGIQRQVDSSVQTQHR